LRPSSVNAAAQQAKQDQRDSAGKNFAPKFVSFRVVIASRSTRGL